MDAAERALLEETVRDAVTSAADGGASVDDVLTELGWLEMLEAEPRDAVEIVFTALGLANAVAGVLDDVVAAALGVEPRADLAVLLPPFGSWSAPGSAPTGLGTARMATAAEVVVVAEGTVATVPASECEVTAIGGVDPAGGWHRVRCASTGGRPVPEGTWSAAVAAAQRAIGHQIVGQSRTVLDLARTHALDRVQFNRPIGSFQAVRHRLAETLVAIEGLEATLGAAWDDGTPITSALAKAAAGRAARTVATHCQQVLAGIGFTTDHPYHLYLKRAMVLEGLFGTADALVLDVGRHLIHTRSAPTLIEL